jgi:transitional endoplasmic reticulum ATPase
MDALALHNVYSNYNQHLSGENTRSRTVILNVVRTQYPSHHVVSVSPDNAEFIEFANAGHATATLITDDDNLERSLCYIPPRKIGRVIDSASGKVADDVHFGQYRYEWDDKEYIIFKATWAECYTVNKPWLFILYPKATGTLGECGRCAEIDALVKALGEYSTVPQKDIYVFDNGYVSRSPKTWESIQHASWDDVIMSPTVKEQLMRDVTSFFEPGTRELYARYLIPYRRGLLLWGTPGNGKTSVIKALIMSLMTRPTDPVPALYVKSVTDRGHGDQAALSKVFDKARRMAPCVVVFEDLDSLVKGDVRSYFLNELDGLDSNDGILMVASTNHLDDIDPSIRSRPSRFDRKYAFELPTVAERELYAKYWKGKLKQNPDIEYPEEVCPLIAQLTDGFSYAYLKEMFVSTLCTMVKGASEEDTDWDVIDSESVIPSSGEATPPEAKETGVELETKASGEEPIAQAATKEVETQADRPQKRQAPKIIVPENLKDNVFLKVVRRQVALLLRNMDDTDAEQSKKSAPVPGMPMLPGMPAPPGMPVHQAVKMF